METETKAGAAFEAKRRQRARELAQALKDREAAFERSIRAGIEALPKQSAKAQRLLALFGEQK